MKFYFCEKCGARLTEEAIARGEGRDKKLGGIYCTNCAVGVMTMEFPKLNEMDARKILEAPNAPETPTTPAATHPPAAAKPRAKRGKSDKREPLGAYGRPPAKSKETRSQGALLLLGAAGVVLLTLVLVLALSGSSGPRQPTETSTATASAPPTPAPIRVPAAVQPARTPPLPPPAEPVKSPEVAETQVLEDVKQSPQPATEAPIQTPDAQVAPVAAPAPPKLEPKPEPKPKPEPQIAPAPPAQPDAGPALDILIRALKNGGPATARGALTQPPLQDHPDAQSLTQVIAVLEDEERAFVAAVDKAVGKTFRWGTSGGRLLNLKDGELIFERDIMINGKPRGTTQTRVPLAVLPAGVRAQMHESIPATPVAWFAHALKALAEDDLAAAEKAAASSENHPLHEPLAKLLARAALAAREKVASEQWQELIELSKKNLGTTQAKQALEKLDAFPSAFEGTAFLKESDYLENGKQLRTALERMAMGLDRNIAKIIHGKIASFDSRTLAIVLEYDCSDEQQMKDFNYARVKDPIGQATLKLKPDKNGIKIATNSHWEDNASLKLALVGAGDLKVQIRYKGMGGLVGYVPRISFYETFAPSKYKAASRGSGPCLSYIYGSKGNVHQIADHPWGATADSIGKIRANVSSSPRVGTSGDLTLERKGKRHIAYFNDKELITYDATSIPKRPGFTISCVGGTTFTLTHIRVECHLAPDWLKGKLGTGK